MVLVHGAGLSADGFRWVAPGLASFVPAVFAFDWRGHGGSSDNPRFETGLDSAHVDLSVETLTEDLVRVITGLACQSSSGMTPAASHEHQPRAQVDPLSAPATTSRVVLIGHSVGASLAIHAAAQLAPRHLISAVVPMEMVEAVTLSALTRMRGVLEARPLAFLDPAEAVDWHLATGLLSNPSTAALAVPPLVTPCKGATASRLWAAERARRRAERQRASALLPTTAASASSCTSMRSLTQLPSAASVSSSSAVSSAGLSLPARSSIGEALLEKSCRHPGDDLKSRPSGDGNDHDADDHRDDDLLSTPGDSADGLLGTVHGPPDLQRPWYGRSRADSVGSLDSSSAWSTDSDLSQSHTVTPTGSVAAALAAETEASLPLISRTSSASSVSQFLANEGTSLDDAIVRVPSGTPPTTSLPGQQAASADALPARRRVLTKVYTWRPNLLEHEAHWEGWVRDTTSQFLSLAIPRLLLLSITPNTDPALLRGQLQGRFAVRCIPDAGHQLHVDAPVQTCVAILDFLARAHVIQGGAGRGFFWAASAAATSAGASSASPMSVTLGHGRV